MDLDNVPEVPEEFDPSKVLFIPFGDLQFCDKINKSDIANVRVTAHFEAIIAGLELFPVADVDSRIAEVHQAVAILVNRYKRSQYKVKEDITKEPTFRFSDKRDWDFVASICMKQALGKTKVRKQELLQFLSKFRKVKDWNKFFKPFNHFGINFENNMLNLAAPMPYSSPTTFKVSITGIYEFLIEFGILYSSHLYDPNSILRQRQPFADVVIDCFGGLSSFSKCFELIYIQGCQGNHAITLPNYVTPPSPQEIPSDPINDLLLQDRDICYQVLPYYTDIRDLIELDKAVVQQNERENYMDLMNKFLCYENKFYEPLFKSWKIGGKHSCNLWFIERNLLHIGSIPIYEMEQNGWHMTTKLYIQAIKDHPNHQQLQLIISESLKGSLKLDFENIAGFDITHLQYLQSVECLSFLHYDGLQEIAKQLQPKKIKLKYRKAGKAINTTSLSSLTAEQEQQEQEQESEGVVSTQATTDNNNNMSLTAAATSNSISDTVVTDTTATSATTTTTTISTVDETTVPSTIKETANEEEQQQQQAGEEEVNEDTEEIICSLPILSALKTIVINESIVDEDLLSLILELNPEKLSEIRFDYVKRFAYNLRLTTMEKLLSTMKRLHVINSTATCIQVLAKSSNIFESIVLNSFERLETSEWERFLRYSPFLQDLQLISFREIHLLSLMNTLKQSTPFLHSLSLRNISVVKHLVPYDGLDSMTSLHKLKIEWINEIDNPAYVLRLIGSIAKHITSLEIMNCNFFPDQYSVFLSSFPQLINLQFTLNERSTIPERYLFVEYLSYIPNVIVTNSSKKTIYFSQGEYFKGEHFSVSMI
jgi:hypothetical protein